MFEFQFLVLCSVAHKTDIFYSHLRLIFKGAGLGVEIRLATVHISDILKLDINIEMDEYMIYSMQIPVPYFQNVDLSRLYVQTIDNTYFSKKVYLQ